VNISQPKLRSEKFDDDDDDDDDNNNNNNNNNIFSPLPPPGRTSLTQRNKHRTRTATVLFTHGGYRYKGRAVLRLTLRHTTDQVHDGQPPSLLPILTQGGPIQLSQLEIQTA